MSEREWPLRIEVGTRVHYGCSSPNTGIVERIDEKRVWAWVRWDKVIRLERHPMNRLFDVTRSLTEWVSFKRGERPCLRCGHRVWEPRRRICNLCRGPS